MDLIKGSALALVLRISSALISFVIAASITKNLGTEESGLYFYITSLILLFVSVCGLGLNNSLLKYVSIFYTQKKIDMLNGVVNKSIMWSTLLSFSLVTIASTYLTLYPDTSNQDKLYYYFFLFTIPSLTIISLLSHAIQAKGEVALSMAIAGIIQPIIFLLINLYYIPKDINMLSISYLISVTFTLVICIAYWMRQKDFEFSFKFDSKILFASCSSLLIFQIFQQFNTVIGQLFLGFWGSNTDIALFAVSIKIATLTGFIMFAVNRVVAPKFASLYAENDLEGLRRKVIQSKQIMLLATVPLILILLTFPEYVLSFFGDEYIKSAQILRALALIQFFAVWAGSVSYLLIMTGQEKAHRNNVIISSVLASVLGCFLVPYSPLWGAVTVSGTCVILTCYLSSRIVKKKLGINMFSLFY